MIAAILLAAAATPTAIDAERAFAADAQELGQWTAFRKYATDDAVMFTPQAGKAHDFLKDLKDPPTAVFWWPGRSYVSCDGKTAINTGPWVRQWGKSVGYFTTVWQRQTDGSWKWLLDHGDELKEPRAEGGDIKPRLAKCDGKPTAVPPPMITTSSGDKSGQGLSADGSLRWHWIVQANGSREFRVEIWNGTGFDEVIVDQVTASK